MTTPDSLSAWVLAAAIEEELIRVEAETGYSVTFATRPLTPDERAAKTKFGDIDAVVTALTEEGVTTIDVLYAAALAAIIEDVFGEEEEGAEDTVEVAALTAALLLLMSRPPARYTREERTAAPKLHRLLDRAYAGGIATIIDEADRQGIDVTDWPKPTPPPVLGALADDIAGHPWRRAVERATTEYTKPQYVLIGVVTRAEVEKFVEATGHAGTIDQLHQGNQAALGMGRLDTVAEYDGTFLRAVASELLDGSTCPRCSAIDGTVYDSLEEAREDYPNGTYIACQGGSRCRGTIVVVYNEPPDEDNPNDPAWQTWQSG